MAAIFEPQGRAVFDKAVVRPISAVGIEEPHGRARFDDALRQIAAGGFAGYVELSLLHPLDVVKTRLQMGGADRGVFDCLKKTFRKEGFRGLYKGILPPILVDIPKTAIKFTAFEQYKRAFSHPDFNPTLTLALAGLASGMTEGLLVTPFEVVKVRQQVDRSAAPGQQKSAFAVAKAIIRTEGLGTNGIFRGLTTTIARNGLFNTIYFSFYHNMKEFVPDAKENPGQNFIGRVLLGFAAGALGSAANISIDVAKSRIQAPQPNAPLRKYHTPIQTIALVYKEEGLRALYKGLSAKILRLGPGGAILLVMYESSYDWLKRNT